ncbi:wax ester/triacylglycerol synthase domain-containing protein [Raineyella sp.]|uniref:wax ester/triacylglycerol synthase domain-containing protein n=1 Tax=Raineyella sp. TaxID=1911550 RepID=UPI002B200859|nr:wax ester/triacylglycerol synthase domain-containing protein [Raineyella sp.]MEA5155355.1 wax ester/triacylglycerol synthase family O-acyltransferase [Raineyella sp.]
MSRNSTGRGPGITRLSADDLVSLAEDSGPVPMQVGVVVMLRTDPDFRPEDVVRSLDARMPGVPRMRQRLIRPALGRGRSFWADDPDFSIDRHVRIVRTTGGPEVALTIADGLVTTPLPRDRPLWAARLVVGLDDGRTAALIFATHHVMADGISGMELLRGLADGPPPVADQAFPRPLPTGPALLADSLREALRWWRRLPHTVRLMLAELDLLRASRRPPIPVSSLNRPVGPRRRSATVSVDLTEARRAARGAGATVNDLVLTAIARALGALLATRGESADEFVMSVLFATPRSGPAGVPGNRSGAVPIAIPTTGDPYERLRIVAGRTAAVKRRHRAALNSLLGPLTRLLAGLGIFPWIAGRQRFIHTIVSSLRVPGRLTIAGREVTGIIPLSVATGNITVVFTSLAYEGRVTVAIMADRDACPDLDTLRDGLAAALAELVALPGPAVEYRGAD